MSYSIETYDKAQSILDRRKEREAPCPRTATKDASRALP